MLTIDELTALVAAETIDTVVVGFTDMYGRLCGKRLDAGFFLAVAASEGTHACDYLLANDMELEPVPGYEFASWDQGYGDVHLVPDHSTLRVADWLEGTALVLCDVVDDATHRPAAVAPRSVLGAQQERLAASGYRAEAATELEYYLSTTSYREAAIGGAPQPAGWDLEDYQILQGTRTESFHAAARRALARSGVPVESTKGEWGLGQHELNVCHTAVGEMADRHVVIKQCLKELADLQGRSVTFMAKPTTDRAGSSCHIHLSLWRDGRNAFVGDLDLGGGVRGSAELGHFLGGCLAHVDEVMVFLAPTVNSYKRYVDGSWAPTRLAWSYDNRTAGFRVVGSGESLRVECRIPGADCNPYLALAAFLAVGIAGIERAVATPEPFTGDVYAANDLPRVPHTLAEAIDRFDAGTFGADAFGKDVAQHYAHFFRTEQRAFDTAVTDWEHRRYYERI